MNISHKCKQLGLAGLMLASVGVSPNALAVTDLILIVDGSVSIDDTEYNTFRDGIAAAVGQITTDGSVQVSAVVFATTAAVRIEPTLVDSVATRDALVAAFQGLDRSNIGGNTCYACGFDSATRLNLNWMDDKQLVNMLTDGAPNRRLDGTQPDLPDRIAKCLVDPTCNGTNEREALRVIGAELISFEGIGLGPLGLDNLQDLAYPNPPGVEIDPPFQAASFPNPIDSQGFVVNVANFAEVQAALEAKFQAAGITQVPEPAVVAMIGIGMVGLAGLRRRRNS